MAPFTLRCFHCRKRLTSYEAPGTGATFIHRCTNEKCGGVDE